MVTFDPRSKLIWAIGGMIVVFSIDQSLGQVFTFGFILILTALFLPSIREVFRSIKFLLLLLPITFIIHIVFAGSSSPIIIDGDAIQYNLSAFEIPIKFTLRMGNFLFFMGFLMKWFSAVEFLDAIRFLLTPLRRLRIPVDDLFQIIFISVRFFPLMREEFWRMDEGWRTFIQQSEKGLRNKILRIRESLIPLMIFSLRRAETLADAMAVRGYGAYGYRSHYSHLSFAGRDALFASIGIMISLTVMIGF